MSQESDKKELFASYLVRAGVVADLATVDLEALKKLSPQLVDYTKTPQDGLYPPMPEPQVDPDFSKHKICIVGAGIAGLYTAYLLDQVGIANYEILEASDRVGGRLYTHHFTDKTHDYYDIGAMRFPESPVMARTFHLFDQTNVKQIKYSMEDVNQPTRFNDRTAFGYDPNNPNAQKAGEDPFKVSVKSGGTVPVETLKKPSIILNDAYDYYREKIKRNPASGFKYLIKHDKFSLRDYLAFVEDQDEATIHWLETLNSATGWFGQAFTENVMESLAFEYDDNVKWKCLDGGTSTLTDEMVRLLKVKPQLKTQVVSVAYDSAPGVDDAEKMVVKFRRDGRVDSRRYAAVINTTTFGALQKMDLTGLDLPYSSKTAIRSLHYDSSTKVGIKFSHPWWRKLKDYPITEGGLGKTDMPLRVCVYPSYNAHDSEKESAVLLASYTWGQDAERIASFVTGRGPEEENDLKELMIYNLARLHTNTEQGFVELEQTIREAWITHHAYDWSKDKFAAGAFALFNPGQFTTLYSTLVRPACDSRFYIVGEAASAHHAWIVGALDSAVRGLHLLLTRFQQFKKREQVKQVFKPCGEIDYDSAHLQVALGMLRHKDQPPLLSTPSAIGAVLDEISAKTEVAAL